MQVPVKPGTKSKDLTVVMKAESLKVAYKTGETIIDGKMWGAVKLDDSTWTLQDNKLVMISMEKYDGMRWWSCVIKGTLLLLHT